MYKILDIEKGEYLWCYYPINNKHLALCCPEFGHTWKRNGKEFKTRWKFFAEKMLRRTLKYNMDLFPRYEVVEVSDD